MSCLIHNQDRNDYIIKKSLFLSLGNQITLFQSIHEPMKLRRLFESQNTKAANFQAKVYPRWSDNDNSLSLEKSLA